MTIAENPLRIRIPDQSTPENLAAGWNYVVDYGKMVLLSGYQYNPDRSGDYFAAVYERLSPGHDCDGEVMLRAISPVMFPDAGYAISWALQESKKY